MSASKRSLKDQQRRPSNPLDADTPAQKRLKSTHAAEPRSTGLASLLGDASPRLTARLTNGVTDKKASKVDDSRAVVSSGINGDADLAISVSSNEDSSDEEAEAEAEAEAEENGIAARSARANGVNGSHKDDEDMVDAADEDDDGADGLSFGDMLTARHPDVITVAAEPHAGAGASALQTVTGFSLGTVLQQALKTNDKDLLERCFELRDVQAVKNTIQRLPSPLVEQLLSRISERMDKRPGRAGSLLLWVQWSLVAHGGYLAGQPDILKRLTALNQVMKQRAQGLQPLLRLKGKLDLLHAQLALRRETQAARQDMVDDVDEEGVTYREGDIETAWDDEEKDARPDQEEEEESVSDNSEEPFHPAQQNESDDDSADEVVPDATAMLDVEAEEDDEADSEDMEDEDNDSEEDASEASFHTSEDDDEDEDDDDDDDEDSAVPPRRPI